MSQIGFQLAETRKKVDQFIKRIVNLEFEPRQLYKAAFHIIEAGGKRLRPFLVLKCCKLVGGKEEDAVPTASAIELLHTFTLIHDDIMDQDEKRRGISTVHTEWGVPIAIVAGDLLFAKVYETITRFRDPSRVSLSRTLRVLRCISRATIAICEGQTLDMLFERRQTVSEDEYFKMIRGKTAALFGVSAKSGGILGGANRDQVKHLGRYGLYVGVAFQLIDDILGLTADEEVLGKPIGSDIREGKRTLVIVHAVKNASEGQRRKILGTLGNKHAPIEQIQETIDLISSLGSVDYAEKRAEEFVKRSKMALSKFPETEDKEDLIKLSDLITTRRY